MLEQIIRWYWSTRVIRFPLSGIGCHRRLYWAGLSYTKPVLAIHGFVAVSARLGSRLCTGLGSALQRRGYTYIPLVHSLWSLVISRVFRQTVAIISIFVVPSSSFSPLRTLCSNTGIQSQYPGLEVSGGRSPDVSSHCQGLSSIVRVMVTTCV